MRDLPKLQRGGRLYIVIGEPYREALWDYFHGDGTAQVWDVDRSYRRDDLLLTLVPTQPRMFIAREIATANGADTSDIQVDWNRSIAFENGVLVDAVAKRAGIRASFSATTKERRPGASGALSTWSTGAMRHGSLRIGYTN